MVIRRGMAMLLLVFGASNAAAHVHLKSSEPADGATLAASPAQITLVFSAAANLTVATLQGPTAGAASKLDVVTNTASAMHSVALPALAPGDYIIAWRALGADGHVMSGEVRFTVREDSAAAQERDAG